MMEEALKIVYRDPKELVPYKQNAKTHGQRQIDLIADSISEFGFNAPILLDGDKGIIAGHGRNIAAIRLGLDRVPTVDLKHLDETRKRAYILADNKLSEVDSGWDEEMLALEFKDLDDFIDLTLTGFTEEELKNVLELPEEIKERSESLCAIKMVRVLISIPSTSVPTLLDEAVEEIIAIGGQVDYGGN